MKLKYILLAFCLFVLSLHSIECEDTAIVQTKSGPIKGTVITFNGEKLNQYIGIPYAEPPIGSNRFAKPKPIQKWNQTLEAIHQPKKCWQNPNVTKDPNQSEDCLFLNIFSQNKTDINLRPVMFWIHGGGLTGGEGGAWPNTLIQNGVIYVSINYRLGPFGFLYGNDSTAPGNVGFLDQVMALQWVNDNIEHFGGDNKQITIFGESAGSWSVCAHIVSPLTKNLFKRAIMESGAYYFRRIFNYSSAAHLDNAKAQSKIHGCNNESNWLQCLRTVQPQEILNKSTFGTALTFGTDVFPFTIDDAMKTGQFHKEVQLIVGINESEGTGWADGGTFGTPKVTNNTHHLTKDELKIQIKSMFSSENASFVEKIYDFYISKVDESNQTLIRKAYIAIYTDTMFKCPSHYYAKNFAKYAPAGNLRFYELTFNSIDSGCHTPAWKGVCHGDELTFVFGNPIVQKATHPAIEYEFSIMINKLWTNFAKTGNPLSQPLINTMGANVTKWDTFKVTDESPVLPKIMELNPKTFGDYFTDPYHAACDGLWNDYFGNA